MNININIRLLTGKHHIFQIKENSTVYDLKTQASSVFSIPFENLAFIYKSNILNNSVKIKDINYDQENQNSFIIAANTLITGDLKNTQNISKNRKENEASNSKRSSISKDRKKQNQNQKDINGNTIPWNIDSLINFIVNLHYSAHYARLALEYTKYDLHRAICLLTTGRAIGPDGREHSCNIIGIGLSDSGSIPGSSFNSKGYGPGNANSNGSIDYGNSDNYDRNSYMNYEETEEPATVPVRRTIEEKKLAETMKEFTEEEKQAITRLCYGRDKSIVVQVFIACDKDEVLTENCLNTMKLD